MENKQLFEAFIKFQEEFQGLKPDSKNPFFKSTYISLDGILQTVRPLLAKQKLAVLQEATGDGEFVYIKTKLIHSSGEYLETEILKMKPSKANDPQQLGSCITYAKRYQLGALLGICETVDDDGNRASGLNNNKKTTAAPVINKTQWEAFMEIAKTKDKNSIIELIKKNGYENSKQILVKDYAKIMEQVKLLE